ncbi:MAG: hypothetical protein IPH45_09020, partial [Bacteroidales bacterium]|nr:hypothetical protein [Bacteroidales bacterium]
LRYPYNSFYSLNINLSNNLSYENKTAFPRLDDSDPVAFLKAQCISQTQYHFPFLEFCGNGGGWLGFAGKIVGNKSTYNCKLQGMPGFFMTYGIPLSKEKHSRFSGV